MVPCIRDTLKTALDMDLEYKFGPTVLSMRVSGDLIKPMVKVSFGMRTGMYMKVSGTMIKQMVMEFMCM